MSILRPKKLKFVILDDSSQDLQLSKPMPYSNGQGYSVNFKYKGKKVYIQTPRMKNLFGLGVYKDEKTDKPKSITITLQIAK